MNADTTNLSLNRAPVNWRRLARVGLVAAVVTSMVNALIGGVAVAQFGVSPELRPFTWPQFGLFTLIGVLGATLVYAWLLSVSAQPVATFRRVALVVVAVSFLPDFGLYFTQAIPDLTAPALGALLLMHVTTALISVRLLTGCPHFG